MLEDSVLSHHKRHQHQQSRIPPATFGYNDWGGASNPEFPEWFWGLLIFLLLFLVISATSKPAASPTIFRFWMAGDVGKMCNFASETRKCALRRPQASALRKLGPLHSK